MLVCYLLTAKTHSMLLPFMILNVFGEIIIDRKPYEKFS